jgi:hypothetical protein
MPSRSFNNTTGQFLTIELDELLDFVERADTPTRQADISPQVRHILKP